MMVSSCYLFLVKYMPVNAIENVSKKLQIYLDEHNLSVLKLSQLIDVKYQTLKRIVEIDNVDSLPNISSIISLARFFDCSLSELLDDKIILPIKCYSSLEAYLNQKASNVIKIYIPISQYKEYKNIKFLFAINIVDVKVTDKLLINGIPYICPTNNIQLFIGMNNVEYDGYYIAKFNNKINIINVISVSSSFLMVEEGENINKIAKDQIEIIAKYISTGTILINSNNNLLAKI